MKIKLVELSSGYGNVQNDVILEENYSSSAQNRANSGYDTYHEVELPEGFRVGKTEWGERFICDADGNEWEPFIRSGKGSTPTRMASIMIQKCSGFERETITLHHV